MNNFVCIYPGTKSAIESEDFKNFDESQTRNHVSNFSLPEMKQSNCLEIPLELMWYLKC